MLRHSPWGKQKSPSRHSFTSRVRDRWGRRPRSNSTGKPHPQPVSPVSISPTAFAQEPRLRGSQVPRPLPAFAPPPPLPTCAGPRPTRGRPVAGRAAAAEGALSVGAMAVGAAGGTRTALVHICGNAAFRKGPGLETLEGFPWGRGVWRSWWVVSRVGYVAEVGGRDQDSLILGTIIGCPWGSPDFWELPVLGSWSQ